MLEVIVFSLFVNMKIPKKYTFILYTNKYEFVDEFVNKLRNKGLNRIRTMEDIHIGDNIQERLSNLIQSTDYIVVIFSKDSLKDELLLHSVKNAFEENKVILPLISDLVEKREIPEEIAKLKFFLYSKEKKDVDTAVSEIMRAIYEQKRKA